jgi:hypothetical protein
MPVKLPAHKNIKSQILNFPAHNSPSSRCLYHHFAFPLTERIRELRTIMPFDQVIEPWLASELVHPLRNFVTCSIPKAREERGKLAKEWCSCGIPEEYGVQCRERNLTR